MVMVMAMAMMMAQVIYDGWLIHPIHWDTHDRVQPSRLESYHVIIFMWKPRE
jgi:hypothetical protein